MEDTLLNNRNESEELKVDFHIMDVKTDAETALVFCLASECRQITKRCFNPAAILEKKRERKGRQDFGTFVNTAVNLLSTLGWPKQLNATK